MDGLKLHMGQSGLEERWGRFRLVMQKQLQFTHALQHLLGWRRNKCRVAGPGASDPVLGSAKFTGGLVAAPTPGEQHTVHLPDQTQ